MHVKDLPLSVVTVTSYPGFMSLAFDGRSMVKRSWLVSPSVPFQPGYYDGFFQNSWLSPLSPPVTKCLANYVVSVERIKQFMHIPPEPAAIVENNRPPSSWPSKGKIQFQDLKLRCHPNAPLVLKGITCAFKEGTQVVIVGRTGSGKTTLITALFCLIKPDSGKILIDGINICSIGHKDLRMKLSVIPQEPTLFKGSITDKFGLDLLDYIQMMRYG
nr:ABC transporter C family member 8-like [Tanacetum cinerariifolium]